MTFNIDTWLKELLSRLQTSFGARIKIAGLQGSFKRGESTPASDIDAVVILDHITPQDIAAYKTILSQMPASQHPICGFFGGAEELKNWSRAELFQFVNDTQLFYGSWEGVIAPLTRQDALLAAHTSAGTIYHALVHTWIHDSLSPQFIKELCKMSFFMFQAAQFVRTGIYPADKKTLLKTLHNPQEQRLISATLKEVSSSEVEDLARTLLSCCQGIFTLK